MRAAVALGSNVGDRHAHLDAAVEALASLGDVVAISSIYETAPVAGPPQADYLNAVAVLETDLEPKELLGRLFAIETARGRERTVRFGPRTLDLDLLLFDDAVIDEPDVSVPHPRMTERRFVLEPLLEVWPDATLPDGTPLAMFLPLVEDQIVWRARRPTS
jgi:2-amino-4-hydroxy-6-hydroxymethyldihydropteridine diphosphokinase